MTAKTITKSNGKKYTNYICATHKKTGGCQNNNVSEFKLSGLVLLAIQQQVAGFIASREVAGSFTGNSQRGRKQAAIEGMIERNMQVIEENNDYLVKSYKHFDSNGVITESEYQMFKKNFNSQIQNAEDSITALRTELERLDDDTNAKRLMERFLEYENLTELNRRVVTGLIKFITVNSTTDISVNFRYASELALPLESPDNDLVSERAVV